MIVFLITRMNIAYIIMSYLNEHIGIMKMKCYLSTLLLMLVSTFFVGPAQAAVAPYYAYGDITARAGDLSLIEANTATSTGALTVKGGAPWFCTTPQCGVTVNPGASLAWGEISVDPVSGTLGARAGSAAYNNNGGFGSAYGYISQVFRVGTDGTLQTGDNVSVDINMLLQGMIDSQSNFGNVQGMILLNHYDPTYKYSNFDGSQIDYMPLGTFQDIFFDPAGSGIFPQLLGSVQHSDSVNPVSDFVNFQGTASADVNVGDVLIMESMIFVENHLAYSDNFSYSWTDFQNTLNSSLTTATLGATINAVPVPAAVWLFGSGLIGLIGIARRKKA